MRYVLARFNKEARERAYRIYICESLFAHGENKRLSMHYADMIKRGNRKVDNRTGDEIAIDVIQRFGLRIEDESI